MLQANVLKRKYNTYRSMFVYTVENVFIENFNLLVNVISSIHLVPYTHFQIVLKILHLKSAIMVAFSRKICFITVIKIVSY